MWGDKIGGRLYDASARGIIPVNVFGLQSQDNTASGGVYST